MRPLFLLPMLAVTALAISQDGPPAKEMLLGRKVFAAFKPDFKAELKLTADQEKKIMEAFQGAMAVEDGRFMITLTDEMDMNQMEKAALKAIDDAQRKRLDEIWIQDLQGLALADDEIGKKLALTAEQQKEIGKLVEAGAAKLTDLFSMDHDEATAKKGAAGRVRQEDGVAAY